MVRIEKNMGVYIFKSVHGPYIKIGHYMGQNAYSRVAHRGFGSCVCPDGLENKVSAHDVELVAWFPSQTKKTEQTIKRKWRTSRIKNSEWMPDHLLPQVMGFLEALEPNKACQCDPVAAALTRRRL